MDINQQLNAMRECYEPGCDAPAMPEADLRILGRDQDGMIFTGQKWHCAAGHWYQIPEDWGDR